MSSKRIKEKTKLIFLKCPCAKNYMGFFQPKCVENFHSINVGQTRFLEANPRLRQLYSPTV